jgi:hypothetical protein
MMLVPVNDGTYSTGRGFALTAARHSHGCMYLKFVCTLAWCNSCHHRHCSSCNGQLAQQPGCTSAVWLGM